MGGLNLVERLRDVTPGFNTLITLDEALHLGLSVIILDEKGKPINTHKKTEFDHEEVRDIDLGGYWLSKPTTEKSAKTPDLFVVPEHFLAETQRKNPGSIVALLEDTSAANLSLRTPADPNANYLRILVDFSGLRGDERQSLQPRIDQITIDQVFNMKTENDRSFERQFRGYSLLDRTFYLNLRPNRDAHINPVRRSTITVQMPERLVGRPKYFGRNRAPPGNFEIPVNFYWMGGRQHGYRFTGNKHLEDMGKIKIKQIEKMYESLWLVPLNSIDEVLDRQRLYAELVEGAEHYGHVRDLSRSINQMIEPYIHLSSMSKLISANTLRSKWGDAIHKKYFYADFMRIAGQFVTQYETFSASLSAISSNSREMQVLLEPLREMAEEGGNFHYSYSFLKSVVDSKPRDFSELKGIFEAELKKSGAKRLEELESYSTLIEFSPREGEDEEDGYGVTNFDHLSSLLQKMGYQPDDENIPEDQIREALKKSTGPKKLIRLDGIKPKDLSELLGRFFDQTPVARSDKHHNYLDYSGSKLAAYIALVDFIKQEGWTRPEILPASEGILDIRNGWYPLINAQTIVRNDTRLDSDRRVEIKDGTNLGGKTVDIRKDFFIAVAALTGNYVPAESARVSFFDRVRFRLKSTGVDYGALTQELGDIQSALNGAGTSLLIGMDETFTSTNYFEGEALTYGLIRKLSKDPRIRAIITSHYPSLQEMLRDKRISGVTFSHFEFERGKQGLVFSHIKKQGPNTEMDYALAVAEGQGLSQAILRHAKEYLGRVQK
ncbi:MAG: hypothetical protein AABX00_01345 [Nanoarchaeota archaeon]